MAEDIDMSEFSDSFYADLMTIADDVETAAEEVATAEAPAADLGQAQLLTQEDLENFLHFKESLGLFICSSASCEVAVLYGTLKKHLSEKHGYSGPLPAWVTECAPHCALNTKDERIEAYTHPKQSHLAVEGLTLELGYACNQCWRAYKSEETFMRHHYKYESPTLVKCTPKYSRLVCHVQRLFKSLNSSFFAVKEPTELNEADQQLVLSLESPVEMMRQISRGDGDPITNGWIKEVSSLGPDKTVALTEVPCKDEDSELFPLVASLERTIQAWVDHFFEEIYPTFSDCVKLGLCSGKEG
jgi:hypothetical protein